eukprot:122735-Prorocentrum_minimum.AAC.1
MIRLRMAKARGTHNLQTVAIIGQGGYFGESGLLKVHPLDEIATARAALTVLFHRRKTLIPPRFARP